MSNLMYSNFVVIKEIIEGINWAIYIASMQIVNRCHWIMALDNDRVLITPILNSDDLWFYSLLL